MSQILRNCINGKFLDLPAVFTICVRYATKPRWVPVAKTKQFRVSMPKPVPPAEDVEIRRLYNNYRAQLRATIEEIKRSYRASATAEDVVLQREKDTEAAWEECMRINDDWNAQLALEREKRDKETLERRIEYAERVMEKEDAKKKALQAQVDQLIREQQELSKTFITKENIDAHIQKILDEEPHSFLWAIDFRGRVYEGYNKAPTPGKRLSVHRLVAANSIPESSENEVQVES